MPLFNQDPELSRRFGLGLGAGLLNTHGRPAGAIMSEALMLGQRNADVERKLRVDDAQAKYYGQRGQMDLFGVAKDLHLQKSNRWSMLKRASVAGQAPDPGPPPDFAETMQEVFAGGAFGGQAKGPGVMAGPQGMPAGQGAPQMPPGMSGPQPMPPSAPGASQPPFDPLMPRPPDSPQPGQLGSGTAGIMPPPLGTHQGPPGQLSPLGPAQAGPPPTMGDMQPLQRSGGATQQALGAAQQAALARLQQLQAWGLADETDVSGANAMATKQVGQWRHDPVTNQWIRDDPEGMVTGPGGVLMRRPGHAESQQQADNVKRMGELGFDIDNAAAINARDRLKAFSAEAGKLDATTRLGGPAARVVERGKKIGGYDADQAPSTVPGVSNQALGAVASKAGDVVVMRGPGGADTANLHGNVFGPGSPGVQTGPTTQQARVSANVTALDANDRGTITKRVADETVKGQAAGDMVNTIRQARAIMPQSTGKAFEALLPVGQWLASINVIPQTRVREIGNAEGFRGLMSDALVGTQAAFKGSVSNVEFTTARETLPTLGTTRVANEFLLDFYQAVGEKQIWYTNQVNRINQEFTNAQRNGQNYDLAGAMGQIDRLVNSEATSVYNQPSMARWSQHLRRGGAQQ